MLPTKNCAFVSFLEDEAGIAAHARLSANLPSIYGKVITVGWGASRPLPDKVTQAVAAGASRNVFIGGSVDRTSEEYLRESLSRFGPVDCVDMLPAKKIAFVHFASMTAAITCKEALQADAQWKDFRLSYGKDRCSPEAKGKPHGDSLNGRRASLPAAPAFPPGAAGYSMTGGGYMPPAGPVMSQASQYAPAFTASPGIPTSNFGFAGERTIYLGGVTEEFNLKDVLDNVQGGMIDHVKILPEKKCCFVAFVDPQAAHNFMATVQQTGFMVNNKHIKVGWGKSKPIPPPLVEALRTGATRNVFLGNVDASITAEKLQNDFSKVGRVIEKIDILPAKKLAFIHFTSIQGAVEAVEELRTEGNPLREEYATCRVNFGRDRCATERINRALKPIMGAMRAPPMMPMIPQDAYMNASQGFQQMENQAAYAPSW